MNTLVESLRVHLTHRSAELSNKCILLMCSAMAKQNTDITTSMLTALHDCIANAKRPAGREAVKQCLISLRGGVGADALDGRIDELVSSTQAQNLKLEIAKLNNSVASKPTTSSELRRHARYCQQHLEHCSTCIPNEYTCGISSCTFNSSQC